MMHNNLKKRCKTYLEEMQKQTQNEENGDKLTQCDQKQAKY